MKKVLSLLLVVVFVLAFSSVAFAMCKEGLKYSPAFEEVDVGEGMVEVWANKYNDDVRFAPDTFQMVVPGNGGANADDNAPLEEWYDDRSLVDPHDTK